LPESFDVGRYHSWIVQDEQLPECFEVTSYDADGLVMSMQHKEYDVQSVQFHPESVLTPLGEKMIENWLNSDNRTKQ
jgi:anthranilate synthase component 2